ncbi:MAG: hypothetical protein HY556_07710 [Euryarchaeota archaeon]|nr:hypothetical protein [Euryarchaeota archaeon]
MQEIVSRQSPDGPALLVSVGMLFPVEPPLVAPVASTSVALEMALVDVMITRAEDRSLAMRASRLPIDAHAAFELREAVE